MQILGFCLLHNGGGLASKGTVAMEPSLPHLFSLIRMKKNKYMHTCRDMCIFNMKYSGAYPAYCGHPSNTLICMAKKQG